MLTESGGQGGETSPTVHAVAGVSGNHNGRVRLFVGGPEAFAEIHRMIGSARHSISIQIYYFREDETGWAIAAALAGKAREGVRVKVLYDESGWLVFHRRNRLIHYLQDHGVSVRQERIFQAPSPPRKSSILSRLAGYLRIGRLILSNEMEYAHRKLIIIDHSCGMIGGMNFGNEYAQADRWHDVMVRVEGEAVMDMQRAFLESWAKAGSEIMRDGTEAEATHTSPPGSSPDNPYIQILPSHKNSQTIKEVLFSAIDTAEKTIHLEHAYIMDDEVIGRLRAAARRGVTIRVIISDKTDFFIYDEVNRKSLNTLLGEKVEVYLYQTHRGRRMIHMKVIAIDGKWTTIGSANLSRRSLNYNQEMNIAVSCREFAEEVELRIFHCDIKNTKRVRKPLSTRWYLSGINLLLRRIL